MGVPRWSAQAATSAPGRLKGSNARSAAPTELAFMRNRSPPAADRFCLLLNGEKHVLPSSHPQCCLQRLGLSGGASFCSGEKHVLPSWVQSVACSAWVLWLRILLWLSLALSLRVWGLSGLECFWLSLSPFLRLWGLSGLECSTDLTNCLSLSPFLCVWGLSGLECSTDLTNCLGSVLSCAHLGTAGLGLGLAGMRNAWLLCAS